MSTRRDALASAAFIFLILSIPLVILGYNGWLIATTSTSFSCSNDLGTDSHSNEPSVLGTQGNAGIAITFNGWSVDNWYSIRSLLNKYEAKVTFFVGNFDYLTNDHFEKLRTLKNDGHEIATQGFQYRNAVDYVANYSLQAYMDDEITPAIELLSENEIDASSFAYPFGSRNSLIDAELLKHFIRLRATAYTSNVTRIVDLNQAYFKWQNETLIRGVGIDSEYENTIEEIIEGMERAKQDNEVLVLYAHTITYDATPYGTPEEILISILEAAQTMNLAFYTVSSLSNTSIPITSIPNTSTESGVTNSMWKLNDLVISLVISCLGIVVLWIFVSVIFHDGRWQFRST